MRPLICFSIFKVAAPLKLEPTVWNYASRLRLSRLTDEDVHTLDDILPAKLLKFGVQAY